ncbi:amino acid ABC transporter permease [uncultured Methylobacterium sp.]|jgi:His/Glu/Gln/Arg/opine family amino acid ABC transporter permease subunit|uniref:amino acid ABC transporter permease n=1 Tax=uncultured Methylobacterium sp. TaxID=157278 RepID=UPI00260184BD|nr:amino acid ABC transporter permease [uncultured Methylobacterium sp.]
MTFDPALLIPYLPLLAAGAWLTLQVAAGAFVLGYLLGIVLALVALVPGRLPRLAVAAIVTVLRGIPFILILFLVYYGLPFWGVRLPAVLVGTVALALFAGAYYAEIIRAAILALPRGQFESARAIGMSPLQAMRHVIAPQILRGLVPPSTNMTLTMIKESAVLSSITVPELTYQGLVIQGNTFAPFEVFAAVTLIYWAITAIVAALAHRLERRTGRAREPLATRNALAASYLSFERPAAR